MIDGLLALLVCQLVGEVVVRLTGLPLPGPVVGMLVFLAVLRVTRPGERSDLVRPPPPCSRTCSCCSCRQVRGSSST